MYNDYYVAQLVRKEVQSIYDCLCYPYNTLQWKNLRKYDKIKKAIDRVLKLTGYPKKVYNHLVLKVLLDSIIFNEDPDIDKKIRHILQKECKDIQDLTYSIWYADLDDEEMPFVGFDLYNTESVRYKVNEYFRYWY